MSVFAFECDLGGGITYPVYVGEVLSKIDEYLELVFAGDKIIIVIDEFIDTNYGELIYPQLIGKYEFKKHVVKGKKDSKTISSVLKIFNVLERENFSRDSLMIGIGGGVIGDMAGFAAGCWYRGMKLIHIPTTLLSAVDSCLGGKTAVNLNNTVNAVGSYHHPIALLIDTKIIANLPAREVSSGLAEVVKYAVVQSKPISDALEQKDYQEIVADVDWFIIESLKTKEYFVRGDISEGDKRLYLNFGHTLGHAIEFATILDGEETLRHGEAVALGMVSIFRISIKLGYLVEENITWLKSILTKFSLPISYSAAILNIDKAGLINECMELVLKDKKRVFNSLRLIVLSDVHVPVIHETTEMSLLRLGFEEVIND